jgi:hypothetical protein
MLLNEVQQQQRQLVAQEEKSAAQSGTIAVQNQLIAAQAAQMRDLKQQMANLTILNQATQVALQKLQAKDEFVTQR